MPELLSASVWAALVRALVRASVRRTGSSASWGTSTRASPSFPACRRHLCRCTNRTAPTRLMPRNVASSSYVNHRPVPVTSCTSVPPLVTGHQLSAAHSVGQQVTDIGDNCRDKCCGRETRQPSTGSSRRHNSLSLAARAILTRAVSRWARPSFVNWAAGSHRPIFSDGSVTWPRGLCAATASQSYLFGSKVLQCCDLRLSHHDASRNDAAPIHARNDRQIGAEATSTHRLTHRLTHSTVHKSVICG
jgi:hypothetical protein